MKETENSNSMNLKSTWKDKVKNNLIMFWPNFEEGYAVTPILFWLIIIFYTIECIYSGSLFPSTDQLLRMGATYGPNTLNTEPWRLLSSIFLHADISHILMNGFGLFIAGALGEISVGSRFFLLAYIFSGIFGGLVSLLHDPIMLSVGASGAIYGAYGLYFSTLFFAIYKNELKKSSLWIIGVMCLFIVASSFKEGVDSFAHLGGLGFGILSGLLWWFLRYKWSFSANETKVVFSLGIVFLLSAVSFWMFIPKTIVKYETLYQKYLNQADIAIHYQDNIDSFPLKTKIDRIKEYGIVGWQKCILLADSMLILKLPIGVKQRATDLKYYANKNKEVADLYLKAWKEDTNKYDDSLIKGYALTDSLFLKYFRIQNK